MKNEQRLNEYIQEWRDTEEEREKMDDELRESEEELFILNCRLLKKYADDQRTNTKTSNRES